jgi:hypothetical protein
VQEARKELKTASKGKFSVDETKVWRAVYQKLISEARARGEVLWDKDAHQKLVEGQAAPLSSKTKVTADMLLAVGLPDLEKEPVAVEGEAVEKVTEKVPAYMDLNIRTVIASLLLPDFERRTALKTLAMVTANLQALGVLDEHGKQVKGEMIRRLRGVDGPFVYYALIARDMDYALARQLCEYLVDHDAIVRLLGRKDEDKRREWIKTRLRERRREEPQVSWEDVEEEYERAFPRELTPIEQVHAEFLAPLPHQELHGGKKAKAIWAEMEDENLSFLEFVEKHELGYEEGNLFSYLARVMRVARMLHEVTSIGEFETVEDGVRRKLAAIDDRVMDPDW